MGLRLLLVGVVAGLGLNLPVRENVSAWKRAAETWVYSRMAEWDARMPTGPSAFVVVAEPNPPAVSDPAPALDALLSPTPVTVAKTEEPAAVAQHPDLNAALDLPTIPMELDEPAEPAATTVPILTDADFDTAMNAVVSDLTADLRATELARQAAIAAVVDDDDLYQGFAYALQRESEELNVALEASQPIEAAPRVESSEVVDDLAFGVDLAPKGGAAGHDHESMPASNDSRSRLTQAVRLTREAVHAWAGLLHGPAVVVITH